MDVRVRFILDCVSVDVTVSKEGLVALYKKMNMNRMFIVTEKDGSFGTAINPRHIRTIEVLKETT